IPRRLRLPTIPHAVPTNRLVLRRVTNDSRKRASSRRRVILDRCRAGRGAVEIEESLRQIDRCRCQSGLYTAVPADSQVIVPLYRNVWIRDTVYTLLAFESVGDIDRLRHGGYALLDRGLLRWSYCLDWRIRE